MAGARPRWDDLDQLRALLMLAGLPYHAGLIYAAHAAWIVDSADESLPMTWLIQFSHTFRMPAFFLIAGIFAMLIIRRRGPAAWLGGRLRRVGIPLLTSLVLVSPLMVMAAATSEGGLGNALPGLLAELRDISSTWTVHLWFLIYLLLYCLLFAGLYALLGAARIGRAAAAAQGVLLRRPALVWLLLPLAGSVTLGAAILAKLLDATYLMGGIFNPAQFVGNGVMFLAGAALVANPAWLERFRSRNLAVWVLAPLVATVMAVFQADEDGGLSRAVTYFLLPVAGLLGAHVALSAARLWLNRPSAFTRAMVRVAMPMYLVHVVFVLWLGVLFQAVPWPAELEILLIVLLAALASYGLSRVVEASPLLSLLFNGTAPERPAAHPAPLARDASALG